MAISQIPALTAHYSESSTIGRPVLGRCNPCQMATSQIPALLWKLIFVRLSVGRSTPPSYGNFTDFCSDNSYFIPTLKAPHLADQVLADVTPVKLQFYRFLIYSESSYLADQVLADLLPHINGNFTDSYSTLRDHIWQTKFGRSTPTSNGNFTDSCEIHISFLLWELNIWPTRSWQIYPPVKWQFYRFLLYSQSSYLADPLSNGDLTDSCEIHISFILWELNIWQTRSWQIYPRSNGNFTDSCSDSSHFMTAHIHSYSESSTFGRPGLGRSTPIWVAISLIPTLTTFYFIPTLRAYHLADQVLAYLPPIQWWFHRFLFWQLTTLRAQHLADQVLSDVTPHIRWQFHRFLLYPESS